MMSSQGRLVLEHARMKLVHGVVGNFWWSSIAQENDLKNNE